MEKVNPYDRKINYLYNCNKNYMDFTALSFGNRKIKYEEMYGNIEKYAKVLYKKGIRQGDIIGVCALNTPESVYLLYALDLLGAVVVGFNPLDAGKKERTKRDLELTKPKMVITVDMMYKNFKDSEKALDFSTILYSPVESIDNLKIKLGYKAIQLSKGNFKLDRNSSLKFLLNDDALDKFVKAEYIPEELTDIMFTGGSTGVHKGVDLSGEGLNCVIEGMNQIFPAEPGMIHLGNIPIGHMVYGRMILQFCIANNMEYAMTLKAMPEDFYDELVRTKSNVAVGGPPHWTSLLEKNGDKLITNSKIIPNSLTNLHYATSGGEAKKSTTDKAIAEALKYAGSDAVLGDGLGATEAWSTMIVSNGKIHTPGTIGVNLPTLDVKLVNPDTNKIVEKGERGILYVSGPSVMLGYHNNQEETDKVISYDENGKKWCNIGDYLVQTDNNEYKYVGRQKRNFVSGVENVYPEELERLVSSIPEVKEVVVLPKSDELRQFIPIYHISIYDESLQIEIFEKRLYELVINNFSENWLPGKIYYYNEPLKRMDNSKIDLKYYENITNQNEKVRKK